MSNTVEPGDKVVFPTGHTLERLENGVSRITDSQGNEITAEDFHQQRLEAAMSGYQSTSAYELREEFKEFFEEPFLKKASDLLSIYRAIGDNPALDRFEEGITGITEEMSEELITLCYQVVKLHHRWQQQSEFPTVDFDVFDDDYQCPICEHIDEDVLEDQALYLANKAEQEEANYLASERTILKLDGPLINTRTGEAN